MVAPFVLGLSHYWRSYGDFYIDVAEVASNINLYHYQHNVSSSDDTARKTAIKASIDGGYYVRNPTTIDWDTITSSYSTRSMAPFTRYNGTPGTILCNPGGLSFTSTHTQPMIARRTSGTIENSPTNIINKPVLWGMPGTDPARVYANKVYTLTGRNLCSPNVDSSVYLLKWDGVSAVDTADLYACTILPGRSGSGDGQSLNRETGSNLLEFYIPESVPADDYYVIVWTNENYYGITQPTKLQVTLVDGDDPWYDDSVIDYQPLDAASNTDISIQLATLLHEHGAAATADAPCVITLPPGIFYLSHIMPVPAHTAIQGSGKGQTIIRPNPGLLGVANTAGSFYSNLSTFSTDSVDPADCYTTPINILDGVFTGEQYLIGSSTAALFRIKGSNVQFRDLTLSTGGRVDRRTVSGCVNASDGINNVHFNCVEFENLLAYDATEARQRTIDRSGRWRYWRFTNCAFNCNEALTALNSPNPFSSVGANDDAMIEGGVYQAPHGTAEWTMFGGLGRAGCIRDMVISRARKGIVLDVDNGYFSCELVFFNNLFVEMQGDFGSCETMLSHGNHGIRVAVASGDNSGSGGKGRFVVNGTTTNRDRMVAQIISGTGTGQYFIVESTSTGGGNATYTIEEPWLQPPDSTSHIILSYGGCDMAFISNRFQDTNGGIMAWGNCLGFEFRSNYFRHSNEAISINCQHYISGADVGASRWHTIQSNVFIGGGGVRLSGARAATEVGSTYTWPMVSRVSLSSNIYYLDVVNQMFAGQGTAITDADDNATLDTYPLVTFISAVNERFRSGLGYYSHNPPSRAMMRRFPWGISNYGVANYSLRSFVFDRGISLLETGHRISTLSILAREADAFNTSGRYTLSELFEEDLVGVAADVTTLLANVATVDGVVDSIYASTGAALATAVGNVQTTVNTINTSVGASLGTNVSAIKTKTDALNISGGDVRASIDNEYTALSLLSSGILATVGAFSDNAGDNTVWGKLKTMEGKVDTVDTVVDTISVSAGANLGANVSAIKGKTDTITLDGSSVVSKLAADGLDDIPPDIPAARGVTFVERLMQLYGQKFGRTELDRENGTITTYAENGTTPATIQTFVATDSVEDISVAEDA